MKGNLANLICETKSVSKQDVLIMVTCPRKVVQWTEIMLKVGYFSLFHWASPDVWRQNTGSKIYACNILLWRILSLNNLRLALHFTPKTFTIHRYLVWNYGVVCTALGAATVSCSCSGYNTGTNCKRRRRGLYKLIIKLLEPHINAKKTTGFQATPRSVEYCHVSCHNDGNVGMQGFQVDNDKYSVNFDLAISDL